MKAIHKKGTVAFYLTPRGGFVEVARVAGQTMKDCADGLAVLIGLCETWENDGPEINSVCIYVRGDRGEIEVITRPGERIATALSLKEGAPVSADRVIGALVAAAKDRCAKGAKP